MIWGYIILQTQAPEGWVFNALSTGGSVGILIVGIWYFTKQIDKLEKKNKDDVKEIVDRYEARIKEVTDRYEARIKEVNDRYEARLLESQSRLDKAYEKIAILTGMANEALSQVTKGQNDLISAIKDMKETYK